MNPCVSVHRTPRLISFAVLGLFVINATAQPSEIKPEPGPNAADIESQFKLPAGFAIHLVAAEPDIANPMTICVDEQGALYVTESHTYRYGPKGSPFQPPTNPIKRIEPNSDGGPARITIVAEGFPEPVVGVHVSAGKMYATCLNELFVMDIGPDGKGTNRKTLVKDAAKPWNPFGMYRVAVGPDDKLWLSIADHPSSEPVTLTGADGRTVRLRGQSGGLVRCNRDGSGLELVVQGLRAPYAFDIDPWGHIWQVSNGEGSPNIFVHVIPGMDYGYHSRQVSYAWLAGKGPVAPPVRDMGAGAYTAALHYYSSMFPRDYVGTIFMANWGCHGANPDNRLIKRFFRRQDGRETNGGADTELLEAAEPFLTTTDPLFRPTSLALAPDGGMYVADWHGRDDESDRTGRVLKIVYTGENKPPAAPTPNEIAAMKPEKLCALLDHPNHFTRELAMRALVQSGDRALEPLGAILEKGAPLAAANAVWTLTRMNSAPAAQTMARALGHPDARVRAHALRQLRQATSAKLLPALAAPCLGDPDAEVRVEAALSLDSPEAIGRGLLAALELATEKRLRYQIGFELGRHGDRATLEKLHASSDPEFQRVALIAADTARHENTALAAVVKDWPLTLPGQDEAERLVAELQTGSTLAETSDQLLALEWLEEHPSAKPLAEFLLACLRDNDYLVQAAALRAVRRGAVDTPEMRSATVRLLDSNHLQVQLAALYTLGTFADDRPQVWRLWLKHPSKVVATAALRALRSRTRTPEFTNALWPEARDAARLHPYLAEETGFTFRQLGLAEAHLAELPAPPAAPADKSQLALAVLSRLKGASALLGQLSFSAPRTMCAGCHSVRPGELRLGPCLADIGAASQPQYLVESILEPSKVIKTGFENVTVKTNDGRFFSGLIETVGTQLVIKSLGAEPVAVPLAEVKRRVASPISPMPEGLEATMTVAELADLTAYLLSLKGSH